VSHVQLEENGLNSYRDSFVTQIESRDSLTSLVYLGSFSNS